MRLLVVCPDYASHAYGLIEIAGAARRRGDEVWFATGEAVRPLVRSAYLTWVPLRLGGGSNPGTIRVGDQPSGEDARLLAFFAAARKGAVETLTYQANARRHDLLFEPDRVLDDLAGIVDRVRPDEVLVDHVSFAATVALYGLDVPYTSVVLGHPTALPAPDELYGCPPAWPAALQPTAGDIEALERCCVEVADAFTDAANDLLARRAPSRPAVADAFALAGKATLFNYPAELHPPDRYVPNGSVFLGSLARRQDLAGQLRPGGSGLRVLVSLGSFFSCRDDILRTAVAAAARSDWALALARGTTPLDALGPIPPGAVIESTLRQVALLDHTDVVVSHGGNNTVTEALWAGRPQVILPLSTDQFAGAAAVERAGLGLVLDPNRLGVSELREAVMTVGRAPYVDRAAALGEQIRARPGAELAAANLGG